MMANMYCRLIGMRPVSILSQEEDDAIIQTITNAGKCQIYNHNLIEIHFVLF